MVTTCVQVQKGIKREVGKDHEYLYLYLDAIKDRAVKPKLLREARELKGIVTRCMVQQLKIATIPVEDNIIACYLCIYSAV